jgi:glycine cleavage system H lipoate-binding protein
MSKNTGTANGELPCIWVQAGVLSYRLCDRHYDCESCDLYRVLRGCGRPVDGLPGPAPASAASRDSARAIEELVSAYVCRLTEGCVLHLDCPYCQSHFWLRSAAGDQVFVGLDGHLLRILHPITDITLPHVGVTLKRGEPCGWITHGRVTIPLDSPVSGAVEAVNDKYIDTLTGNGRCATVDDWMLCVEAEESLESIPGLYRGESTLVWYLSKVQLMKRYLREALSRGDSAVGITLADGGEPNLNVEQVLGRERFEDLVEELFRLQI